MTLLWKEIKSFNDYNEKYFEIFKYLLLNKVWPQRFPNDSEFKNFLLTKDIYNTQSKNKLYLLERLESDNSRESYVWNLIEEWVLSIEHIMPQTLTPDWENELWENNKEIHSKYLHTLWNITLTGYNSKYSNRAFKDKKTIENWFNESPLFLNNFIRTCENWTEKEIHERYELLKDKALKTWILPTTEYEVKKDTAKLFTLDDETNFTWEKIDSFNIFWSNYAVKYWAEMYEIVMKKLYEADPISLKKFIDEDYFEKRQNKEVTWNMNTDEWLATVLFASPKENIKTIKISDDFYIETSLSVNSIFYRLRAIFDKLNIEYSDLEFYIK